MNKKQLMAKYAKRMLLLTCLMLVSSAGLLAQHTYSVNSVPDPVKKNSFVSNPDGILSESTEALINNYLREFEAENGVEINVVAVDDIGDEVVESFANELFNYWGIGKRKENNGLLILFVLKQRAVRFETGYGLEGDLPDAICKRIQTKLMVPHFKEGDYDSGMIAGVEAVIDKLKNGDSSSVAGLEDENESRTFWQKYRGLIIFTLVANAIVLLFAAKSVRANRNKDNDERFKKFNSMGCLLLFLCLFFPLLIPVCIYMFVQKGVARRRPRTCRKCHGPMRLLSEQEENLYLTEMAQAEERIRSVDYDVWLCTKCGNTDALIYPRRFSRYEECPFCNAKASKKIANRVIKSATRSSSGRGERTCKCEFCGKISVKEYTIPRITSSSSHSSSSSSSSSHSSSSSSHGGGSSGGGGSTSRW